MRKTIISTLTAGMLLAGCVLVPMDAPLPARACPPGQAKKGLCAPDSERGFCPPGQAKKGAC